MEDGQGTTGVVTQLGTHVVGGGAWRASHQRQRGEAEAGEMIPVPSQRRWARPPGSAMRPPASDVARQATHAWLALLSTTRPGCRSVASSTQTTPATSSALRRRRVSPNRSGWPDGPPVGGAQAQAWQDMADRMRPQGPASQRRVGLRALDEDRTLVRRRRRLTTIFSTGAKIAKASRDGRGRAQHGKTACKQRQCRGFQYISSALDWTLTCRLLFSFFPPVSTCRCTSPPPSLSPPPPARPRRLHGSEPNILLRLRDSSRHQQLRLRARGRRHATGEHA